MSKAKINSGGMSNVKAASNNRSLIVVQSCKYDGRIHREWRAGLVLQTADLIVLEGVFESEVRHPQLGIIKRGTRSLEFFWLHRWYNIFRFREPDGALRNFYCNINMPPAFDGKVLAFIDLDLDVLVRKDLTLSVLDADEFEANAARFAYPADVRASAFRALDELKEMIAARAFPFDWKPSERVFPF
jgi:protein associated with RNAse G/E